MNITETVTISRDEYTRLISTAEAAEDAAANAAYLSTRDEESIPIEVADRLLNGDPPMKVWREYRGFRLHDLASQVDASISYLSELENNKKSGRLPLWKRIAEALEIDLDDLV